MARRKPIPARTAPGSHATPAADRGGTAGRAPIAAWQWWLLAAALPIYLLASRLTLDLWGDEVYTLYDFAARPVAQIVTDYSAPNNHILYSLLLHPLAVGTQAEPLLRLPSLLFAVATLALVFRVAWRVSGVKAAVTATLALGLNVMFLTHAMQVRGYSLSMLLAAWLMDLAIPLAGDARNPTGTSPLSTSGRLVRYLSIVLAGAAFLYVMPSNAIFLAPLGVAAVKLAWNRRKEQAGSSRLGGLPWRVGLAWLLAWPLALLAYWPVAAQVRAAGGTLAAPLAPRALVELVENVYWAAGHDLLPLLIAVPIVLYRLARARASAQHQELSPTADGPTPSSCSLYLLAAMLVGPLVVSWMLGTTPFVRNFCPLLPAVALACGWLVSAALGDFGGGNRQATARPALSWVAIGLTVVMLLPAVLLYPGRLEAIRTQRHAQDGYYNYYAANFEPARVARYLGAAIDTDEDFIVLYADGDQYNLGHYLARAGLPLPPKRLTDRAPGPVRARLFCVVPELAAWDEVAELVGLPVDELRAFPVVESAGYYRIHASPHAVELARTAPVISGPAIKEQGPANASR